MDADVLRVKRPHKTRFSNQFDSTNSLQSAARCCSKIIHSAQTGTAFFAGYVWKSNEIVIRKQATGWQGV